jgi:RimJ/RimL family protein N-acetyltransferase
MVIIETDRLIVRELALSDAAELAPLLGDPEVMRFSIKGVHTLEDTCAMIAQCISSYEKFGFGQWGLVHKDSSTLIGYCGLGLLALDGTQQTEIGYRLLRSRWGQGFATEAAAHVLGYGFEQLGLQTIIAIVQAENVASVRVVRKIGLSYFKETRYHQREVQVYRKTVSEWSAKQHDGACAKHDRQA